MIKRVTLWPLVLGLLLTFLNASHVRADTSATWQGTIDEIETWITIVARGHDISEERKQKPWWEWGNTTTDAYLFAFERADNVRLILAFDQLPNGSSEAKFYLNEFGTQPIDYLLEGDQLTIQSNDGYPYLILRTQEGGTSWLVDNHTNYNLEWEVDGFLPGIGHFEAETDGIIDVKSRVGEESLGVPGWEVVQLVNDLHPTWGVPRFNPILRMSDAPPFQVAPPLMPTFPYFGIGAKTINWFRENPNPFYFNLKRFEFQKFRFPGFQNGGMYYLNSMRQAPDVSFESPFAFYAFNPTSRYAHLLVRGEYFAADDLHISDQNREKSSFRYSWKIKDDQAWQYGLTFAGAYTYDQEMEIGGVKFWGVYPENLPTWVTSKSWPLVTFIEAIEGAGSSEGIYFYTAQEVENWPWLDGLTDKPPSFLAEPYLQPDARLVRHSGLSLPIAFRGEYNAANVQPSKLYFSPIDNYLHLLYAQGGVWNLGEGHVLRYHNKSGGPHLDGWTREEVPLEVDEHNESGFPPAVPGEVIESLYALQDYLIYSGPQGVELRQATYQLSNLELAPPKDKASWTSFAEKVQPLRSNHKDPMNLKSWLSDFPGQRLLITKARLFDLRATEESFRFVLELQPGFEIQPFDWTQEPQNALFDTSDLTSGQYIVTYDGQWTVQPATLPDSEANAMLSITLALPEDEKSLSIVDEIPIQALVENSALRDLNAVQLVGEMSQGENTLQITKQQIDLLSGELIAIPLNLQPKSAGEWTLRFWLEDQEEKILLETSQPVTISGSSETRRGTVFSLSTGGAQQSLVVFLLVAFAVSMMSALFVAQRKT